MLCKKCHQAINDIHRDLADLEREGTLTLHDEDAAEDEIEQITEDCDQLGGDDCMKREEWKR